MTEHARFEAASDARALDATFEELVEARIERSPQPLSRRERIGAATVGGAFLVTATLVAAVVPWQRPLAVGLAAAMVAVYALVSRVAFETGTGVHVPTQLVLAPLLFTLPAPLVPLLVAAGLALADLGESLRAERRHPERVLTALVSSWHSVPPAVIVALFASPDVRWSEWPIYVAALAASYAVEAVVLCFDHGISYGHRPRMVVGSLVPGWAVDALLAPIGLLIAFAQGSFRGAFLFAAPLAVLLWLLARERRLAIERALELARAYRRANEQARCDELTRLGNRLAWDEAVARDEARLQRSGGRASVVLLDGDGLKRANDLRGHRVGDELIRALARVVKAAARDGDVVARVGGDEIAILLVDADESACVAFVGRVRALLARHEPIEGIPVSAAIGHATCPPAVSLADALELADARMYAAKRRDSRAAAGAG